MSKIIDFLKKILEKFKGFDPFQLKIRGCGNLLCFLYYLLLLCSFIALGFFFSKYMFSEGLNQENEKNQILKKAVASWENRNFNESLKKSEFEAKFHFSNNTNKLVFHWEYKFLEGDQKKTKFHKLGEKHSFPTDFFFLDIDTKVMGLILGKVKFINDDKWDLRVNESVFCLEILGNTKKNEKIERNDQNLKNTKTQKVNKIIKNNEKASKNRKNSMYSIKNQDNSLFQKSKGIRLHFWKFQEKKYTNIDCTTRLDCRKICLDNYLLYFHESFIHDKFLNNTLTCQIPLVLTDVCFIITYDEKGDLKYQNGCYNGSPERFSPLKLNEEFQFNRTRFFIREPLDPYITAYNLVENNNNYIESSILVYEFEKIFDFWLILKEILVSGLCLGLVLIFGLFAYKRKGRFRFGRRDVEMEEFNQFEISSAASIKL